MKAALALAAGLLAGGMALAAEGLGLRMAADTRWSGVAAPAAPGAQGGMLYPAPTPLAGLVAVFTHGALVSGMRSADEKRRQEEADKALLPYRASLDGWDARALAEAALPLVATAGPRTLADAPGAAPRQVVEAAPSFSLHADQSRLVLVNKLRVLDTGGSAAPWEVTVQVLSNRRPDDAAFPPDDGAAALKTEAARLFAHSVDLALYLHARPVAAEQPPMRTHRYVDGAGEGIERGQLLAGGCARAVIRTLRGVILSVPVKPAEGDPPPPADCAAQPYRLPA